MLEQLKNQLKQEKTQRAILQGVGTVGIFIATTVINAKMKEGLKSGIDALMTHLHGTITVTPK